MREKWSDILLKMPIESFYHKSMVGMFRLAAQYQPDKIAVQWKDERITYRELEEKSNQVARYICNLGIEPYNCVAIMAGRTIETIIGIFGIWKSGCAYCFIDTKYPSARNRECVEECKAEVILDKEMILEAIEEESAGYFEEKGKPGRRAVIVYTSGSTQKPKGAVLTHLNILASVSNHDALHIDSDDVYCCFASLQFVASVFDICLSLSIGCTLNLIPKELRRDIHMIAQYYIDNNITVAFLPPHMAKKYQQIDEGSPLKVLIVGSEPARNLEPRSYEVAHVYASTEACAVITVYWIKEKKNSYPVGRPVPTVRARIVDENGNDVPDGEKGELWISGPQIADGYLDMDEEMQSHFENIRVPGSNRYRHIYKTGDVMHKDENGDLVFDGRADFMVKIRGFRIELPLIEEAILGYEGITDVCATSYQDDGGTNILFAYYISENEIDHESLRTYISEHIPYYMVPTGLVRVAEFPRKLNGKTDRKAFTVPPEINDYKLLKKIYR